MDPNLLSMRFFKPWRALSVFLKFLKSISRVKETVKLEFHQVLIHGKNWRVNKCHVQILLLDRRDKINVVLNALVYGFDLLFDQKFGENVNSFLNYLSIERLAKNEDLVKICLFHD